VEAHCGALAALGESLVGHATSIGLPVPRSSLAGFAERHRRAVGALLQTLAPISLAAVLRRYYAEKVAEFSAAARGGSSDAGSGDEVGPGPATALPHKQEKRVAAQQDSVQNEEALLPRTPNQWRRTSSQRSDSWLEAWP
jgi:hypothetical protein